MTEPVKPFYGQDARGVLCVRHSDYERLEQECATAQHEKALAFSDLQRCKAERDTALQLLAQCQEHLDPYRQTALRREVFDALQGHINDPE